MSEQNESSVTEITEVMDQMSKATGYQFVKLTRQQAAAARDTASELIKAQLKHEAGSVKSEESLESIYRDALPEGVTMDHVHAVDQTDNIMIAATTKAIGELAVENIAADRSILAVNGSVVVREGVNVDLRVKGSHTYPGMVRDGNKLPDTVVYGDSRLVVTRKSNSSSAGLIGSTRDELTAMAESLMNK